MAIDFNAIETSTYVLVGVALGTFLVGAILGIVAFVMVKRLQGGDSVLFGRASWAHVVLGLLLGPVEIVTGSVEIAYLRAGSL